MEEEEEEEEEEYTFYDVATVLFHTTKFAK
jgi:hypothetical protein